MLLLGALGTFHSKSTGLDVGISSHTSLAGLVLLAGTWHWAFWDLDMFVLKQVLSLDLLRVFGIHLVPNSGCGLQCLKHRECIGSFTPSNGVDSFDGLIYCMVWCCI